MLVVHALMHLVCVHVQAVPGVLLQRGGDAEANVGTGRGQDIQERQEDTQTQVLWVTLAVLGCTTYGMQAAVVG